MTHTRIVKMASGQPDDLRQRVIALGEMIGAILVASGGSVTVPEEVAKDMPVGKITTERNEDGSFVVSFIRHRSQ